MAFDTSVLDKTGWHILEELQHNGRLSFAELGRRVGLTLPAVAERVRKMQDAGIITGFHARVDPAKIGLPIAAFIRISVVGDVFARVAKAVREMPRCWNAIAAPAPIPSPSELQSSPCSIWKA